MSYSVHGVTMVEIANDRETSIRFQEWFIAQGITSHPGHGICTADSYCGFFDTKHHDAIRAWLSKRADDTMGQTKQP